MNDDHIRHIVLFLNVSSQDNLHLHLSMSRYDADSECFCPKTTTDEDELRTLRRQKRLAQRGTQFIDKSQTPAGLAKYYACVRELDTLVNRVVGAQVVEKPKRRKH